MRSAAGPMDEDGLRWKLPCSAGHTACYISPYGDVYPCVQFPLPSGNVRRSEVYGHLAAFAGIERSALDHDQRSARLFAMCIWVELVRDVPGLAYMEGNMRGPSTQDCEKSFARTGVPSVNLQKKKPAMAQLVQIQIMPVLRAMAEAMQVG